MPSKIFWAYQKFSHLDELLSNEEMMSTSLVASICRELWLAIKEQAKEEANR